MNDIGHFPDRIGDIGNHVKYCEHILRRLILGCSRDLDYSYCEMV